MQNNELFEAKYYICPHCPSTKTHAVYSQNKHVLRYRKIVGRDCVPKDEPVHAK